MPSFTTISAVKSLLTISGSELDVAIGSNIRFASDNLQRWTGRQFEAETGVTKKFTTLGQAVIAIPDLRTVTSATLQDTALDADDTYWLIPDKNNSGVYTSIQVRAFGTYSYLSSPQWFDRNLDNLYYRYGRWNSLPNDLVITGNWGHDPLPDGLVHATNVLAGWYTKRKDSLLANVQLSETGAIMDYSAMPPEVIRFVETWKIGEMAVAV